MDWNKLLNIALLTLAFSLILQWSMGKDKGQSATTTNTVYMEIEKASTIVPNIPNITISNTTASPVNIDTCKDIALFINSEKVQDIGKTLSTSSFCQTISIATNEKQKLPLGALSSIFANDNLTGTYVLKLSINGQEKITTFTHSAPGAIRSFLSTVVYEPIYNLFVALLQFLPGHSLGWAIITITLIIRLILLVPQNHMLVSQKKLQKIQPKIKEIQEKHKGDQATLGMEMMALYKKEGVNPLGSCLPLLIQMPILIGLYWVISGVNDPSNHYHLYSYFRDFDISRISADFYGLDLLQIGGVVGIVFALVLGGIQWVQAKLSFAYNPPVKKDTPKVLEQKPDGEITTPDLALDPAMMQKMMLYVFPVMIAVSSYFFPIGVGLYWFIGTLFVIAQQWVVNKQK